MASLLKSLVGLTGKLAGGLNLRPLRDPATIRTESYLRVSIVRGRLGS